MRKCETPEPADASAVANYARLNLIGDSPPFVDCVRLIFRIAACEATALIQGETGTGKELAARALHYLAARRNAPFIAVNCGAPTPAPLAKDHRMLKNCRAKPARVSLQGREAPTRGVVPADDSSAYLLASVLHREALRSRRRAPLLLFRVGISRNEGSPGICFCRSVLGTRTECPHRK